MFQGFKVSRFQGFKVSRFQGFKVTVSNQTFPSLYRRSLDITTSVPLSTYSLCITCTIYVKKYFHEIISLFKVEGVAVAGDEHESDKLMSGLR